MVKNVLRTIVVNAPVQRVYEMWADFPSFPRFMPTVRQIVMEGRRLYWTGIYGAKVQQWEAEIVELNPHRRVAWHRSVGRHHHAVVTLHAITDGQTEVTMGAEYDLARGETDVKAVRFELYLEGFKRLAEGSIPGGLVLPGDGYPQGAHPW